MRHIGDEVQQQEQELQGQRTIYDTGRVATHAFFYLETFFFIMLIFVEAGGQLYLGIQKQDAAHEPECSHVC
jgi:hypothetical protein